MRRKCEQHCGADAAVYAMGPKAGDWAGWYCIPCQEALKFHVTDRIERVEAQEKLLAAQMKVIDAILDK